MIDNIIKLSRFCRITACLLLLPLAANPAALSPAAARERLLTYIDQTSSYAASFTQQLTSANGQTEAAGGGQFWLARPAQFKWLYDRPFAREIVADGERIWLYDADLDQVTVRDLAPILANTPAGLLAGDTRNLDDYKIAGTGAVDGETNSGNMDATIVLTPSEAGSDFERITMRLADGALQSLLLDDRFGQQTLIEFTDARINVPIDDGVFGFVVPANADVIDETGGT